MEQSSNNSSTKEYWAVFINLAATVLSIIGSILVIIGVFSGLFHAKYYNFSSERPSEYLSDYIDFIKTNHLSDLSDDIKFYYITIIAIVVILLSIFILACINIFTSIITTIKKKNTCNRNIIMSTIIVLLITLVRLLLYINSSDLKMKNDIGFYLIFISQIVVYIVSVLMKIVMVKVLCSDYDFRKYLFRSILAMISFFVTMLLLNSFGETMCIYVVNHKTFLTGVGHRVNFFFRNSSYVDKQYLLVNTVILLSELAIYLYSVFLLLISTSTIIKLRKSHSGKKAFLTIVSLIFVILQLILISTSERYYKDYNIYIDYKASTMIFIQLYVLILYVIICITSLLLEKKSTRRI